MTNGIQQVDIVGRLGKLAGQRSLENLTNCPVLTWPTETCLQLGLFPYHFQPICEECAQKRLHLEGTSGMQSCCSYRLYVLFIDSIGGFVV